MKFHEDLIFKNVGQEYGPILLKIINIKGKIEKIHQTEFSIIDPKMYKPDLVFETKDKIIILEFQSSYIDINDKKRFRLYTAIIDHLKNELNKKIEIHVLSTVELEKTKWYNINDESSFPIYIHTLQNYNGDEFLNIINAKIENEESLNEQELIMLTLVPFMKTKEDIGHNILKTTILITNIKNLNKDIDQFIKGISLILTDKFVEDESLNITIRNLLGGNMKIVEDYAKDKVNEEKKEIIINMYNDGIKKEDIARLTRVTLNFVEKALSQ